MKLSFIPRAGVPVRDPRLQPVQGGAFCYLTAPVELDETERAAQQLLRHVRRGELDAGNPRTAALAGIAWAPSAKAED